MHKVLGRRSSNGLNLKGGTAVRGQKEGIHIAQSSLRGWFIVDDDLMTWGTFRQRTTWLLVSALFRYLFTL